MYLADRISQRNKIYTIACNECQLDTLRPVSSHHRRISGCFIITAVLYMVFTGLQDVFLLMVFPYPTHFPKGVSGVVRLKMKRQQHSHVIYFIVLQFKGFILMCVSKVWAFCSHFLFTSNETSNRIQEHDSATSLSILCTSSENIKCVSWLRIYLRLSSSKHIS